MLRNLTLKVVVLGKTVCMEVPGPLLDMDIKATTAHSFNPPRNDDRGKEQTSGYLRPGGLSQDALVNLYCLLRDREPRLIAKAHRTYVPRKLVPQP